MSFDKQKFAELLEKAKGNRSINHYAQKSGVTSAHISRLLRCLLDSPPTPQTIKKLADHAHNGVTYKDLMEAAGYIDDNTKTDLPELTEKDERDVQKELEKIIKGLKTGSGFAAFGGVDIDELDEEDRELLIASLENSLRLAKRIAKQKFTPKKYRKE
ncbi:XRE family transcriptional regulator [Geobacillus sp. FSL K6-0789]|uniref:XRE family transcriptional regulator n=1 Tax=Geobacillus stearothermophilus TaxID=1422 RepID=A0A3L7CTS3_GEOSE|nr:XRE family transcriptional regulator [Geobacillus stearothermophilus]MED3732517.1 XRE family transcriptional regulator [Geobacillus stearothermophilus]MED3740151.1 XRE family transcriptional regulator [Geobacillus stearothermophilus]MED3766006.1 XRE family transcriptional regulator [Geobacillus stearothermophilus]MED3773693.1 XRE family transcriptional regulator [Geobacillus stearothermophilus]RLQ08674.1 XRE family transcriptional regulator [Geobacillus stearothermophilus]